MSKRTSVLAGLDLQKVATDAAANSAAAASEEPSKAAAKRRARPDIVHTSVYIPKATYQRLRRIAFERDCKIHDLFVEGLDEVLAKHGMAGIERSDKKKGR